MSSHYQVRPLSELYPAKDIALVVVLIAIIIPIGVSLAAFITSH